MIDAHHQQQDPSKHVELDKSFHLAIRVALLPWLYNSFCLCSISRRDDFDLSLSSDLMRYGEQRFFP